VFLRYDLDPQYFVAEELDLTLLLSVRFDRVLSNRLPMPRAVFVPLQVIRTLAVKLRLTRS